MVIDPRSSEQHPAALQRIFDNKTHTFLLAGSRVSSSSGVSDNKKWYFKGDNTPEVVKFLKENLTFNSFSKNPMDELILHIFGAVAQFQRSIIKEAQREGIKLRKDRGEYKGRKRVFTDEKLKDIGAFYITDLKKKVHEYLRFYATKEFFLTA